MNGISMYTGPEITMRGYTGGAMEFFGLTISFVSLGNISEIRHLLQDPFSFVNDGWWWSARGFCTRWQILTIMVSVPKRCLISLSHSLSVRCS